MVGTIFFVGRFFSLGIFFARHFLPSQALFLVKLFPGTSFLMKPNPKLLSNRQNVHARIDLESIFIDSDVCNFGRHVLRDWCEPCKIFAKQKCSHSNYSR